MSSTPARPFGLLYGAPTNVPSPNMDWLEAPGCGYVQNRTIANNAAWLAAARSAGMESLYYLNLVEHPIQWVPSDEEFHVYGDFGAYTNVPDNWWWTGNKATASSRVNYSGHYMLNIRPGSPFALHVIEYVVDFWTRQNGRFEGFFLDVFGNRLWVSVWGTMCDTVDAVAGDGRKEAENWIRGVHWIISQIRAALGPEVIIVANNVFNSRGLADSGHSLPALPAISGGYASMQKGGHPALNGCMFEGCAGGATTGQHPVSEITATIAGDAIGNTPEGFEWATQAGDRKRFIAISSAATVSGNPGAQTDMQAYVGIPDLWVGAMESGYTSKSQSQVTGTATTAWDDHIAGWEWSAPGSEEGDTTAPAAPTALSAGPASGSTVSLTWTLPSLDDRVSFTVARKASAWGSGEAPSSGVTVLTRTPGAAGTDGASIANVPGGTWWFKGFTTDAAGNVATGGPQSSITVAGTPTPPPVAVDAITMTGAAGTKPEATLWSDPDTRMTGVAQSSLARLDGSGRLSCPVEAAVGGAYGSVVIQRLVRYTWTAAAPRRRLGASIGGSGPAGGSTSFYLVGPSGTTNGGGLSNVYGSSDWLRFELIGTDFRITRRIGGAVTELYSGAAPSTYFPVELLLSPDDLKVLADGDQVLDLAPWVDDFTNAFSEAFLYLEFANDDGTTPWVGLVGDIAFERATPSAPVAPTVQVQAGATVYTAAVAPADELITNWLFYADGVLVSQGAGLVQTGPELAPGDHLIGIQTENASPFTES